MPPPKPKLGQHFLVDDAACLRIAASLGDLTHRTVVEIGPGHGAITQHLARTAARLHCIELDESLARELAFRFRNQPQVTVHQGNILATDLAGFGSPGQPLDLVGNLPYYITSEILLHIYAAARAGLVSRAVFMMQREVADRLAAQPGSSEYGALSAFTGMHAQVTPLFTLPPGAFSPPPEVHSTVVRLDMAPRFHELGVEPTGFNAFLRSTFAQKRKTLSNNLRNAGYSAHQVREAWPGDLAPQARAESVTLEQMSSLYLELGGIAGTVKPAS